MPIPAQELFVLTVNELATYSSATSVRDALRAAFLLRRLLLDRDRLVDQANQGRRHKISFTVSSMARRSLYENNPIGPPLAAMIALDPSVTPSDTISVTRKKFLGLPAIQVRDSILSVRDVVSMAANEGGGVHLAPSQSHEFKVVSSQMPLIGSMLPKVVSAISRIVCHGMAGLRNDIIGSPPQEDGLCRYEAPFGGEIELERKTWFHTDDMSEKPLRGMHLAAMINIDRKQGARERVIYEIGGKSMESARLRLGVLPGRRLVWSLRRKGRRLVSAVSADRLAAGAYNIIHAIAAIEGRGATLKIMGGQTKIGCASRRTRVEEVPVHRQVIGADWNGNNGAAFSIKAMAMYRRPLDEEEQWRLGRYMYLSYS